MPVLLMPSSVGFKEETEGYGVDPTIAAADMVRVGSAHSIQNPTATVDVDEVRRSFDLAAPLPVGEKVSGTIPINMRGCVTGGLKPEGSVLYKCTFGNEFESEVMTTDTGDSSLNKITVTDAIDSDSIRVGNAILIDPLGGTPPVNEVVFVTAVDYDTKVITVSPNMSIGHVPGITITKGVHYYTSLDDLPSFWIQYWEGDKFVQKFAGNKIASMTLTIGTSAIIVPTFTFQGQKLVSQVAQTYEESGLGDPEYNSLKPMVGVNQQVDVGGNSAKCASFEIVLTNELVEREGVSTTGIIEIFRVGRTTEGSFDTYKENLDIYNDFKDLVDNEGIIVCGRNNNAEGEVCAIRMPKMRYTDAEVTVNNKAFQYGVKYRALLTKGEDTITMSFL